MPRSAASTYRRCPASIGVKSSPCPASCIVAGLLDQRWMQQHVTGDRDRQALHTRARRVVPWTAGPPVRRPIRGPRRSSVRPRPRQAVPLVLTCADCADFAALIAVSTWASVPRPVPRSRSAAPRPQRRSALPPPRAAVRLGESGGTGWRSTPAPGACASVGAAAASAPASRQCGRSGGAMVGGGTVRDGVSRSSPWGSARCGVSRWVAAAESTPVTDRASSVAGVRSVRSAARVSVPAAKRPADVTVG